MIVETMDFVTKHWHLLLGCTSAFAYMFKQISAMRQGMKALLRADLIRMYNKYHDDLGYCPIYVKQALNDEYKQYVSLHGNGVIPTLYEALMALPTEPPKGE